MGETVLFNLIVEVNKHDGSLNLLDIVEEVVHLSSHKEAYPDDTEEEPGPSSEEEARNRDPVPYCRYRGNKMRSIPRTTPVPVSAPAEPVASTASTSAEMVVPPGMVLMTSAELDKLVRDVGLHTKLSKSLGDRLRKLQDRASATATTSGSASATGPSTTASSASVSGPVVVPFSVPVVRAGDRTCALCSRTFHNTSRLRGHLNTHLGNEFPCSRCDKKLSSRPSLDEHLKTCKVAKTFKCLVSGCGKAFATQKILNAHSKTHSELVEGDEAVCACGASFTRLKSKREHWTFCKSNPAYKGPWYCAVDGCILKETKHAFRRPKDLNSHIRRVHEFDPKH